MTKRVFGYLRVSGKGQVDGDGFDRQRETIESFCASKGWTVIRWFEEPAVSGTIEGTDRPAFGEMLGLLGGEFDTVVVERSDRLARDLIVSELIFASAREVGGKIFAADSGQELVEAGADPTRILIRQFMGALAQWEKSVLVKKLRAARDRKRAENGRCEGPLPFELTAHGAPVARMIFDSYTSGQSFSQITRELNQRHIPAPGGGKWFRSSVHSIYTRFSRRNVSLHPAEPVADFIGFTGVA